MGTVHVLEHPLLQHKLSILRDEKTGVKIFRELVGEMAMLMCYEATRNLPTEQVQVKTPMGMADCRVLSGQKAGHCPHFAGRARHGGRDPCADPLGQGRAHRALSGPGDPSAGGVLLQDAAGYLRAHSDGAGPHAGNRRFCLGSAAVLNGVWV